MEWHGHLGMHMYVLVHLLNCFACLVCLLSSLLTHSPLNLRLILLKSPGSKTRTLFNHLARNVPLLLHIQKYISVSAHLPCRGKLGEDEKLFI